MLNRKATILAGVRDHCVNTGGVHENSGKMDYFGVR